MKENRMKILREKYWGKILGKNTKRKVLREKVLREKREGKMKHGEKDEYFTH